MSLKRLFSPVHQFFNLTPGPEVPDDVARDFRHNVLVNGLDSIWWAFGESFLTVTTILPVFVSHLTSSPLIIGLIPALINAGWFAPQFFMAATVERLPRKLPAVRILSAIERLPFLGMALVAFLQPGINTPVVLALLIGLVIWRALASGIVALPWQELIATLIPASHRGRYIGFSHLLGQVAGLGGAALSGIILGALPFPYNFALTFGAGFVCFATSYVFLIQSKEPMQPARGSAPGPERSTWARARQILRDDTNFRRFLASRGLTYLGSMASGFLAVYAVSRLHLRDADVAIFTGALVAGSALGSLVFGWIGDRYGYKPVMQIASVLWAIALLMVLVAPEVIVYDAAFLLIGLSNGANVTADLNVVMELGPVADRPTYIGLSRTVLGPVLFVAPLLGGQIAAWGSYPLMIGCSLAFTGVGLVVLWLGVVEPRLLARSSGLAD